MHHAKPFLTKVMMSVLTALLTLFAVIVNGLVLAVIARFKSLRTVPNIFVANLAFVDLLNAVINMSSSMMYHVLEANWFRGKALGIMTSISNRLFTILNLASMLAMMADAYLAISFEIRYHVWKTKKKAFVCVFLIWSISIVMMILSSIPSLDVDLGDAHVREYRAEIFEQAKYFVASFMVFFIVSDLVVYVLTTRAIRQKKKQRAALNLTAIQAEARLKDEIKAIDTITITIVAYFLCYVPTILYAATGFKKGTLPDAWFGFVSWYSLYISSAVNPIIYYLRKRRCRSAFKKFLKDPLGSSNFEEKPNRQGNGAKRHDEVVGRRGNGEMAESMGACEVVRDRNKTKHELLGKQRSGLKISAMEASDTALYCHREVGQRRGNGHEGEECVEARATNHKRRQNTYKGNKEETKQGDDEGSEKCNLEKKAWVQEEEQWQEPKQEQEQSHHVKRNSWKQKQAKVEARREEREREEEEEEEEEEQQQQQRQQQQQQRGKGGEKEEKKQAEVEVEAEQVGSEH